MMKTSNRDQSQVASHLHVELRGENDVSQVAFVHNGEQILFINTCEDECIVRFNGESPFADKSAEYRISPGTHVLSTSIGGAINRQYKYEVHCIKKDDDHGHDHDPHKGDPVIVITG